MDEPETPAGHAGPVDEDPEVTSAFAALAHAEARRTENTRFRFRPWHAVVLFAGLAAIPTLLGHLFPAAGS